jgi:hypothetical protein
MTTKKETTKKEAPKPKQTLKSEALADLNEVRKLVQKAIDDGATNVEQVHKTIANLPLKYLEKFEMIEDRARSAQKVQEKTIGQVYQMLRNINAKAADFAEEILRKAKAR